CVLLLVHPGGRRPTPRGTREVRGRSSIEADGNGFPATTTEDRLRRPRVLLRSPMVLLPCTEGARPRRVTPPQGLSSAEAESLNQRTIPLDVHSHEVVEQSATTADQQQQTTTRMVVLLVHLEVLGEVGDPLRQQGHLRLGRSRVGLVKTELGQDRFLLLRGQSHVFTPRLCA